eukprot:gene1836-33254_t
MIARLTGIDPKKELLFCNLLSITEGVLPYYILIDSKRNEVVISIRGTMSKTDALTDLLCEPAVIDLGIEITGGKNASQQTPMTDSPQAVIDLGMEITGGKNASQQTPMTDSPR